VSDFPKPHPISKVPRSDGSPSEQRVSNRIHSRMKLWLCRYYPSSRASSLPQARACLQMVAITLLEALLRQMVEIEYLGWAFETRNGDGARGLRSDQQERQEFSKPAKLRAAAQGTFRGKDYGYHCELGGHPVPGTSILRRGDSAISQSLLSDLLGHVGRIWDHLVGWAQQNGNGDPILKRSRSLSSRFAEWKSKDPLVDLPPPP
jgi:hypothetical protein